MACGTTVDVLCCNVLVQICHMVIRTIVGLARHIIPLSLITIALFLFLFLAI